MSEPVKDVEILQSNIALGQDQNPSVELLERPTSLETQSLIINLVPPFPTPNREPGVTVQKHQEQVVDKVESEIEEEGTTEQQCLSASQSFTDETIVSESVPHNILKSSPRYLSNELNKQKLGMNFRNEMAYSLTKKLSDFEKKRLEAELKATEEIAKIKQSVIEKRLALELAALKECKDYQRTTDSRPTQAQIKAIEEAAQKKQALIEQKLNQEIDALEYQNYRPLTPAPPPKLPPQLGKPGIFKTEAVYTNAMQAPTDYMNMPPSISEYRKLNPLGVRSLQPPDRREGNFNVPSAESRYLNLPSPRFINQMNDRMEFSDQGTAGLVPLMPIKNRSVWKSMISKVKGKFRHQKPQPWD